ncbi:DnaJ domain-containing protein [Bdellovibrio sp. NC01]|uniref:DnaJ domain-containing protein n=1 Tax=Bdellovibrio sp. NC01 TaxID=2220073 RepID=UPI001159CAAA|nr:DnaJ domain-containing protein [Bdellovibrio sp. NC01]QDK37182.1 J domain-containing protein [Bdellovibrio sp. NC01]
MSFQTSFKQILKEKMNEGTGSQVNFSSEMSADPANLAYLMGHIGRFEFQKPRGQYAAPKVRPQRKPHSFSTAQRQSFEFLKTWIHDLSEGYSESELKKAFRQAALILHPDRGGNTQQFIELKAHYESLKAIFTK